MYSSAEKEILQQTILLLREMGLGYFRARSFAKEALSDCVAQAEADGFRHVRNLGDLRVNEKDFIEPREEAGLNKDDIRRFWNRNYVHIMVENYAPICDMTRFALYKELIGEGKTSKEAVRELRCVFIYYGDPENSHENFQGEDADIYHEFVYRFEKWRDGLTPADTQALSQQYSTYNAMVRAMIRNKEL